MSNFDTHNDTTTTMKAKPKTPKPGRPPKDPNECRSHKFIVTLTPPERVSLERLARKYNCTMNEVFRQVLIAY